MIVNQSISDFFIKALILILIIFSVFESKAQTEDNDYPLTTKCATFHSNRNQFLVNKKIARITELNRPDLQKTHVSLSGRFLIHYDTSGFNSVSKIDVDKNGTSDYIDSVSYYFEYVYHKQVTEMGYLAPPSDNGVGGSDAYDIYILNIGIGDLNSSGTYGYTQPNDIPLPGGKPNRLRYASFIVIDNDFSSLDSSYTSQGKKYRTYYDTSFTALKITTAHEFHHAIQFMYGEDPSAPCINEMTSTWFEYRLFPETKDYIQYIKFLFNNPAAYPFGKGNPDNGYLYCIFGQYLNKEYGDSSIRRFWELIADGVQSYDAINKMLIERNSSLESDWCNFTDWIYHSGKRSKPNYGFDSAAIFPEITFYKNEFFAKPAFSNTEGLLSYEFRFFRIKFGKENINETPDTLDLIAASTDLKSAIFQSDYEMPYVFSVVDNNLPGYSQIGNTKYYFNLEKPKGNICHTAKLSSGEVSRSICFAYPNPIIENTHESIVFPAPANSMVGTSARISLYNSELENVLSKSIPVSVDNGNRVLLIEAKELNLPSGVYIFEIGDNGECIGKIAIISNK